MSINCTRIDKKPTNVIKYDGDLECTSLQSPALTGYQLRLNILMYPEKSRRSRWTVVRSERFFG